MSFKKNDSYDLSVEDLTHDGAGVAKVGGIPIFIPGALVGELVRCRVIRVKSKYAIGKLEAVLTPSPDRVLAPCSVYGKCGGCQLQHLDYDAQLAWKQSLVQRHMTHIAKSEVDVHPPIGVGDNSFSKDLRPLNPVSEAWRYRHKAILPFGESVTGTPIIGFYAAHSHRVIPISDCLIQAGPFAAIVAATLAFVRDSGLRIYDEEKHRGIVRALILRRSSTTGRVVVGLSINAKTCESLSAWTTYLQDIPEVQGAFFCRNLEANNVPLSGEIVPLWGDLVLMEALGGVSFLLGPMSFFQVNPSQAARIVAHLKGLQMRCVSPPIVWDLYAGVGTMGLVFAREAEQVVCVEIVPEAAQLCRLNADENGLHNVHVIEGPLEACLDQLAVLPLPDVVILDPPRQGCHAAVLEFLNQRRIPKILYVSCDSATFARDSQILAAEYTCTDLQPIDMFPMTRHIEVMGVFTKKLS